MSSLSSSPVASTTTGSIYSIPNNCIYLVEIIFYAIFLSYTTFLLFRKGRKNAHGWVSLTIFSVMKIAGSAMLLSVAATEHKGDVPSTGLITAGLILSSIALGPLENAGLAFISQG
ncbi:hypothetical protein AWJ20_425 [Sugiyamaella lignohabitans]|uniref:DUF7702 domain-containing protein n=1 Tax=Sugiyamaella lignohabitans TaxID=796027 RepID=A0A167CWI6_9ASCO|nr:uncharacterized protein AWJ20_425 [Sugiyamaella lignohabitans]ANB12186.1 hypothetical protein AWJ20_425 [Sugiyamaella lignohabitans]